MLGTIIRKELLTNLLSRRIVICYAVIGLLVIFSITIRGMHYKAVESTYRTNVERFDKEPEAETDETAAGEEQPDLWWQYDVQIPPARLGIFYQGFSSDISRPFNIDIKYAETRPLGDYALESPVLAVYRVYDLLFITAFIISLLVIFISYDALAGEKERGTFRLVLANQISKSKLILGKLIGGALSVSIPYLLSVVVGVLILQAGMGITFTGREYLLLACFLGLAVFFILLVYLASMLCSALYRTPAAALFTCLTLWLVVAFGIPYFSVYTARALKPVVTFGEYYQQVGAIKTEERQVARDKTVELRKQYKGTELDWKIKMAFRQSHMRMGERWNEQRRAYKGALRRQAELGTALARVSPVGILILAASRFTRTGLDARYHAAAWKKDLEIANKTVFDEKSFALEKVNRDRKMAGQKPLQLLKQPFDPGTLPNRIYPGIPLTDILRNSLADVLILILEAVALFMACYLFFIRKQEL